MKKKQISIEEFKGQLGEIYPLVEKIWKEICKEGFCVEPQDNLGTKEQPIDKCTELEKILITCITYMEDGQEKAILIQYLLLLIYKNHQIAQGVKVEVRKSFIIVVVG